MNTDRRITFAAFIILVSPAGLPQLTLAQTSQPVRISVGNEADALRRETMENLLNLRAGPGRVTDFNLPPEFVGRVADRILIAAFEEQFRRVATDSATTRPDVRPTSRPAPTSKEAGVRLIVDNTSPRLKAHRKMWSEDYPGLRGFSAQITDPIWFDTAADGTTRPRPYWPFALRENANAPMREATAIVARDLAKAGILETTYRVTAVKGLIASNTDEMEVTRILREVGIPVDLLVMFEVENEPGFQTIEKTVRVLRGLGEGGRLQRRIRFNFRATRPGWQLCTESGDANISGLHLQLSRGDDWLAFGDGGSVDIARQLAEALPALRIVASIEQKHLDNFLHEATNWKGRRTGETWAIVEKQSVSQWAQDNCKFGWIDGLPDTALRFARVPRYPSRAECGAVFVPSEAAAIGGVALPGVCKVEQSPLLFQGGNLVCVWDAAKKQRVLLIGEAEIYRNVALGLTRKQVEKAFRIEFGVDRLVVLPAASFHIDYEVSVRNVNGQTIALVNDEAEAAGRVLSCAANALVKSGDLTDLEAVAAEKPCFGRGDVMMMNAFSRVLSRASRGGGALSQSLADKFSRGPADSGVGNLLCFLHALDLWTAQHVQDQAPEAAIQASLAAMRRREAVRSRLQAQLKALGWKVVPIPSMGDSKRGLNYLNGIHDKSRFFMPAYGGAFEKVDQAAQAAVRQAFGPSVEIVPIRSAESQRREGSVRCSAAVMYAAP